MIAALDEPPRGAITVRRATAPPTGPPRGGPDGALSGLVDASDGRVWLWFRNIAGTGLVPLLDRFQLNDIAEIRALHTR
ncbi:hypothetical protein [Actinomadura sp. 9N215]|uniref:hypothetical protein n=1 Tax=Actinomadura sp. 9N215 TaxID=3375150 RepID=UPI00379FCFD6